MPTWNSEMGETSTVDFHCCTVHLDITKVFFLVTNGSTIYWLRSTLKFTLKFKCKFNVNFNVLLSKYIVHPLVKIKKTLISTVNVHYNDSL